MEEIAAASIEQGRGIEQVNQAITQMDEVTQQNAALVEEAAAASQSLQDQGRHLMDAVAFFQMEGAVTSAPNVRSVGKTAKLAQKRAPAVRVAQLKTAGDEGWSTF